MTSTGKRKPLLGRFFLIWLGHLLLSALLLVGALAVATAAHEDGGTPVFARVIQFGADILLLPIVISRMLLPESQSLDFSPLHLALNSALWAAVWLAIVRFLDRRAGRHRR